MNTSARTSKRTWVRRVLGTTVMLTLGLATLAGIVFAGATVTSRSTIQPVPTSSIGTSAASLRYAEPGSAANPTAMRLGRRLVVAFVAGSSGTVASDLLVRWPVVITGCQAGRGAGRPQR